jgi:hypothetical protein
MRLASSKPWMAVLRLVRDWNLDLIRQLIVTDFALHLLTALHDVLLAYPAPRMEPGCLINLVSSLVNLASPANLVKIFAGPSTSNAPTPLYFVSGRPAFPSTVLTLVLETCNALLASALVEPIAPAAFEAFGVTSDPAHILHAALKSLSLTSVSISEEKPDIRLGSTNEGQDAISGFRKIAQVWWNELIGAGSGGEGSLTRRNSLASNDEDDALAASNAMVSLLFDKRYN